MLQQRNLVCHTPVQAEPEMKMTRGRRCRWNRVTILYRRTCCSPKPRLCMIWNSTSSICACVRGRDSTGFVSGNH